MSFKLLLITFVFTSTGVWKSRTKFNMFRGAHDMKNTRVADKSILFVLLLLAIILTCLWLAILDNRSTCKELDILNGGWNESINKTKHVLLEIDASNNTSRSKILDFETYKRVENTLVIWGPILDKTVRILYWWWKQNIFLTSEQKARCLSDRRFGWDARSVIENNGDEIRIERSRQTIENEQACNRRLGQNITTIMRITWAAVICVQPGLIIRKYLSTAINTVENDEKNTDDDWTEPIRLHTTP